MSIETSYGFRSAQAAYENANPYDGECTCEDAGYICDSCGLVDSANWGSCPETNNHPDDIAMMRHLTAEEVVEHFPSQECPQHGWCGGCSSRYCGDCAP